jgi:hypothetical protein
MKRISIFFALLFVFGSSFSQNVLVFNSGRTLAFTRLEAQSNYLDVWPSIDRDIIQPPIDSIWGYYKLGPNKDILQINLADDSEGSELNYQFLPYGLRGKINSYSYPVPFTTQDDESSNYLFLEKDGQTDMIFPYSFGSTKENSIKAFKKYIGDSEDILKEVNAPDYQHDFDNVARLVNTYNLLTYKPLAGPEDPKAIITFYRMKQGESKKEKVRLFLDGKEVGFNPYNIRNIEVSTENLQKLCLKSDEAETCLLIKGLPYFRLYYQVSLDKKGRGQIIIREKGQAFTDIKEIRRLK